MINRQLDNGFGVEGTTAETLLGGLVLWRPAWSRLGVKEEDAGVDFGKEEKSQKRFGKEKIFFGKRGDR